MVKEITQTTLVLGGGPAGLTAGYLLGKRDRDVLVLEAEDQVGGLAKTVERDGYRFDLGGHRFFTKALEVDDPGPRSSATSSFGGPHVTHLLEQEVPRLSAARPGCDQEARAGRARAVHGLVPRRCSTSEGRREVPRAVGDESVRSPPLRDLLPELHGRSGAFPARRSARSGRRNASRGCRSSPLRGLRTSATAATRSESHLLQLLSLRGRARWDAMTDAIHAQGGEVLLSAPVTRLES